jgi:hypothetical protein
MLLLEERIEMQIETDFSLVSFDALKILGELSILT